VTSIQATHMLLIPTAPPTGPPSAPLPPVPGPSRISEHEQLLLSSSSNRTRRSDKYSLNSRRESVVSLSSTGHGGTRTGIASNRYSIASSPPPQPSRQIFTAMPQLSDIENDDDEDAAGAILGQTFPRAQPIPHRRYSRRSHRGANKSLTDIDFRDILGAQIFDQPPPSPLTHVRHLSSPSSPATPATSHLSHIIPLLRFRLLLLQSFTRLLWPIFPSPLGVSTLQFLKTSRILLGSKSRRPSPLRWLSSKTAVLHTISYGQTFRLAETKPLAEYL